MGRGAVGGERCGTCKAGLLAALPAQAGPDFSRVDTPVI